MKLRAVRYPQHDEVCRWLEDQLREPQDAGEMYRLGMETGGWDRSAVFRAACSIGVVSIRQDNRHNTWYLDDPEQK